MFTPQLQVKIHFSDLDQDQTKHTLLFRLIFLPFSLCLLFLLPEYFTSAEMYCTAHHFVEGKLAMVNQTATVLAFYQLKYLVIHFHYIQCNGHFYSIYGTSMSNRNIG